MKTEIITLFEKAISTVKGEGGDGDVLIVTDGPTRAPEMARLFQEYLELTNNKDYTRITDYKGYCIFNGVDWREESISFLDGHNLTSKDVTDMRDVSYMIIQTTDL